MARFVQWLQTTSSQGRKVLVFAETKRGCDILCRDLRYQGIPSIAIHGDKEQRERDRILNDFKTGRCNVLIATDVASRGLDIKNIEFVVNFDCPKTIEDYIHRIGRTGRAGAHGVAVTFFSTTDGFGPGQGMPEKARMARDICRVIQDVGQMPPTDFMQIAARAPGGPGTRTWGGRPGNPMGGGRGGRGRGGGGRGGGGFRGGRGGYGGGRSQNANHGMQSTLPSGVSGGMGGMGGGKPMGGNSYGGQGGGMNMGGYGGGHMGGQGGYQKGMGQQQASGMAAMQFSQSALAGR
uniref:Helicase C-terminal domain-containing protein n=1 Tax=Chromera velia CCMP2878 TaxID=1169474 RepID=A0A0G4H2C7_9ALVE|eukprot:Cvel_24355.t1-p1 / transcript=Cvel_24355.t1 / gene=Cvel_24355 / organism=Chromera_velia_CCMP2878 / gene_product=DEAD-box ATP-dependent RNA helicase 30, putative / transcript_product=DEAD-box ATP-dependent RNA helicase 30, putative / location=Cvel_scaffold2620:1196-3437(+) / protein_length=292 / sequence_SO=supercontig / SO=protein_coding / is_pseudo=false